MRRYPLTLETMVLINEEEEMTFGDFLSEQGNFWPLKELEQIETCLRFGAQYLSEQGDLSIELAH